MKDNHGNIVDAALLDSPPHHAIVRNADGYLKYKSPVSKKMKSYHRLLVGAQPGQIVDHIDGDPRNNTRANLRILSHGQNMLNRKMQSNNTSGYRHVVKAGKKWRAMIQGKHPVHLGMFATKEGAADAVQAYNDANPDRSQWMRK